MKKILLPFLILTLSFTFFVTEVSAHYTANHNYQNRYTHNRSWNSSSKRVYSPKYGYTKGRNYRKYSAGRTLKYYARRRRPDWRKRSYHGYGNFPYHAYHSYASGYLSRYQPYHNNSYAAYGQLVTTPGLHSHTSAYPTPHSYMHAHSHSHDSHGYRQQTSEAFNQHKDTYYNRRVANPPKGMEQWKQWLEG